MTFNSKRLRQYNVKEYAGPLSERPDHLPFGDYYYAEDEEVLYKYNYEGIPKSIGNSSVVGDSIYNSDGNISNENRIVTGLSGANLLFDFYDTTPSNYNTNGSIGILNNGVFMSYETGDGAGSETGEQSIIIDGTMSVIDQINFKGLEYESDYSNNFTDNSLVTKKYVDDNSGGTDTNIYNTDGTIAENRFVSIVQGGSLFFEDLNTTPLGIQYLDDYSATFTDRSHWSS